jgi:pimeloyl-ACP methyl ester carboxylesterase
MGETSSAAGDLREREPLVLPDGRRLALCEVGDPHGHVALYLHATGSSRLEIALYGEAAARRGVRLVAWDRPGAGGSDPQPGRSLLDVVADTAAVCAELGVDRPVAVGLSGGGCHVLALASAAPQVVRAGVAINPVPPAEDDIMGLGPAGFRMLMKLARRRPRLFGLVADRRERGGRITRAISRRSLDPVDVRLMQRPEFALLFWRAIDEGLRQPGEYAKECLMLWGRPWGVSLTSFAVPLHLFAGEHDPFAPFCVWLRAAGAELEVFPGGHLSGFAPAALDHIMTVVAAS